MTRNMTRTRTEASTHIADACARIGTTKTAHARIANGKKNTPQKETKMSDRKIDALRKAVMFQGSHPLHHRQVMARHRKEWPVLWKAIDQLLAAPKETTNE